MRGRISGKGALVEQVLLKLARQLRAFDEASLMALWDKYADSVSRFEPSQRWEESVLVLAMIQGMRFKNQLFNHHWAEGRLPGQPAATAPAVAAPAPAAADRPGEAGEPAPATAAGKPRRGKVLAFRPKERGES
uniref:Uncharacterized protein n=1 Tax=Desulfovibrio sp. U5L TaxID=596152 RepID=I2PWD6_9BACT